MTCKPGYFSFILTALFFLGNHSFAQVDTSHTVEDSSVVNGAADSSNSDGYTQSDTAITQTFYSNNNDSIIQWKRRKEFAYMYYLDSFLHKRKDLRSDTMNIENGTLSKTKSAIDSGNNTGTNNILNSFPVKIVLWLLAAFFIGFILYKLFFKSGLFKRDRVIYNNDEGTEEEKIYKYDEYNHLISEAESDKDFSLATRYLYLQSLMRLSEQELIVFTRDKTNNQYVQELAGHICQPEFQSLTHNYEYIWYGKFSIESAVYTRLKEQFILFNKEI